MTVSEVWGTHRRFEGVVVLTRPLGALDGPSQVNLS